MPGNPRVDRASKLIRASPQVLYAAYMNPRSLAQWLPPKGMQCEIHTFEAREGGRYEMTLTYESEEHSGQGKSSSHSDFVRAKFVKLVPDRKIVQEIQFDSKDPAFSGAMTMSWTFTAVPGGTEVAIACENVPTGIRPEDHTQGMTSSLENLAAFAEQPRPGSR